MLRITFLLRVVAVAMAVSVAPFSRAEKEDAALLRLAVGEFVYAGASDDRFILKGKILIDEARNVDHRADLVGAGTGRLSGYLKWATFEKNGKIHADGSELVELEVEARSRHGDMRGFPRVYFALLKDGAIHSVGFFDERGIYRAHVRVQPKKSEASGR